MAKANSKEEKKIKSSKVKEVEEKKAEDMKENKEEIAEKSKKDEEVELLKKQLEDMKATIELLIKTQNNIPIPSSKTNEEDVIIGCRVLQGVGWTDENTGDMVLYFNEEQSMPVSDFKKLLRNREVKKLFENGLCYLKNEEDYKIFNINKNIDLSDENLKSILAQGNVNDIIRNLDKITNNQKNGSLVNCIIFRICDMIRKKVFEWDYYTRKAIEDYFGVSFDRGISTLQDMEKFKH